MRRSPRSQTGRKFGPAIRGLNCRCHKPIPFDAFTLHRTRPRNCTGYASHRRSYLPALNHRHSSVLNTCSIGIDEDAGRATVRSYAPTDSENVSSSTLLQCPYALEDYFTCVDEKWMSFCWFEKTPWATYSVLLPNCHQDSPINSIPSDSASFRQPWLQSTLPG